MRGRFVAAVLALVLLAFPAAAAPVLELPPPVEAFPVPAPPEVTARSWILYDDTYGITLAEYEADAERPMASTTKIMTALVALDRADPEDLVTVSAEAAAVGESEIGLVAGEKFLLRTLLVAMLVRSANDAAVAIAEYAGGSVEGFVALMNAKAEELGLEHTRFANPHGLDARGHYSSARDLLTMARVAMADPEFARAVRTRKVSLRPAPDGTERFADATNLLLSTYPGAIGVKTGYTGQAGLVLVAAAERDGRRLYAVVMGSEGPGAHFADASALLDYGFDLFDVVPAVMTGRLPTPEADPDLVATGRLEALVHAGTVPTVPSETVEEPDVPAAPVPVATARRGQPPAGLAEALGWFLRYWRVLMGDG